MNKLIIVRGLPGTKRQFLADKLAKGMGAIVLSNLEPVQNIQNLTDSVPVVIIQGVFQSLESMMPYKRLAIGQADVMVFTTLRNGTYRQLAEAGGCNILTISDLIDAWEDDPSEFVVSCP